MRKTKIVCTIGPASSDPEIMRGMLKAGMDVARLNFSHGTHDQHRETIANFRKVRDELDMPAAIILDTKGPEIRLKTFEKGEIELANGDKFILTTRDLIGNEDIVSVTYPDFTEYLKKDDIILISDGKIELQVEAIDDTDVITRVTHGGKISDHKGVNVPAIDFGMDYISDQDRSDILFGIKQDVDYIFASFMRSADDAVQMRSLLDDNGGGDIGIIAKIENIQGVNNFDEILPFVDGIMVARGDLGVEVPFEKIPGMQKDLIRKCMKKGKIAITATQMLDSMIENPIPTRAEITDVANAVFDGTSAVMLSGETATGKYPVEAVATMAKICRQAEVDDNYRYLQEELWDESDAYDVTNAIAHAACTLAEDIGASAIMAATNSGFTASRMSKFRPDIMIIGATPLNKSYHKMSLFWGVVPIKAGYRAEIEELYGHFASKAVDMKLVREGSMIVISAGLPVESHGQSNAIRVVRALSRD